MVLAIVTLATKVPLATFAHVPTTATTMDIVLMEPADALLDTVALTAL